MPSFGGRIGRHLGETVSSLSESSPRPLSGMQGSSTTTSLQLEEKEEGRKPKGDSGAPRNQKRFAAASLPPSGRSVQTTKDRGRWGDKGPLRLYRPIRDIRGSSLPPGGSGSGGSGFGAAHRRVEKLYTRRSARSSRRSSPDSYAQLTPSNGYLKYHEITLLYSDVRALKDDWLTDTNIAFWEEYIEHEILPKYPQAHIGLMRPSLVALMVQADRLRDIQEALPDFRNETHIFLPISDSINAGRRADTGSHWSLLLVSKIDGVAFHYDSMNDHNESNARATVDRLSRHLGIPLRFYRIMEMPQQTNSSDCGVIVCILMRHLLVKKLLGANAREKVSMSLQGKQIDAHGGRKEMLKIVEQMRKEGERRRSTGALPLILRPGNTPPYID